jgi:hypothetical protein
MHKTAVRVTLVAIVLASAAAAALFLRDLDRQAADLASVERQSSARLDRLHDAITAAGAAQQAYIAPGQTERRSFERMTSLVRQIYDETAALKLMLRSPQAQSAVQDLNTATANLIAADSRARENLRLGQDAMAADVIFSDGRSTLDAMSERTHAARAAEQAAYEDARAGLSRRRWTALGIVAVAWLAALVALVPVRRDETAAASTTTAPIAEIAAERMEPPASPQPVIDLTAAADLCTALSRITTTAALPPLLARAADLLDASGIILWLGAGEELFAVTAHGYRPEVISRLGPLPRTADNATASAWREARTTIVAGDEAGNGAIVTPMFGPDACIGALAVELRHGREREGATAAFASMITAQLATVVSAWPAASSAPDLRAANG